MQQNLQIQKQLSTYEKTDSLLDDSFIKQFIGGNQIKCISTPFNQNINQKVNIVFNGNQGGGRKINRKLICESQPAKRISFFTKYYQTKQLKSPNPQRSQIPKLLTNRLIPTLQNPTNPHILIRSFSSTTLKSKTSIQRTSKNKYRKISDYQSQKSIKIINFK